MAAKAEPRPVTADSQTSADPRDGGRIPDGGGHPTRSIGLFARSPRWGTLVRDPGIRRASSVRIKPVVPWGAEVLIPNQRTPGSRGLAMTAPGRSDCRGGRLEASPSRQAITVADGDLDGHPGPVAPGSARGAPHVHFIALRIVRVSLQEQPHEHRVHDLLLISLGRPPSAWVPPGPASLIPSRTGRGQYGPGDTRSMPKQPVGPVLIGSVPRRPGSPRAQLQTL